MKSLLDILNESTKTYNFKIRVAGELPENFEDKLERSLNKYKIKNFSKAKTIPISEKPLDFPQLQNCEVTHFDAELTYPTTNHVLESYLTLELNFPQTHLRVRNENDPIEEYQDDTDSKPYEALITTEDMGGESGQQSVGNSRIMDLLKELETARKERDLDPTAGIKKEGK